MDFVAIEEGTALGLWPPRTRAGLDPRRPGELADRLERFRRVFLREIGSRAGGLILLDLRPVRARFAGRWPERRGKVLAIVEGALAHELDEEELYLVADETTVWVFVLEGEPAALRLRGEELAALAGERLFGSASASAAVGVRVLPFDLEEGLRGIVGLGALRERMERARGRLEAVEADAFAARASELVARYRPILSLKLAAIVAYRVFARLPLPGGGWAPPEIVCPEASTGAFAAALDRWLAERVASELGGPGLRSARALLVLPVHHATLGTPAWRRPWRARLEALGPAPLRRLGIELVDHDPRQHGTALESTLDLLAELAAVPILRLPLEAAAEPGPLRTFARAGVKVVSFEASGLDEAARGQSERLAATARACSEAGLRSLLVRVNRVGLAEAARRAGFDYMAGDGCLPALAAPGPATGAMAA